jgi:hypothetical protein
MNRTRIIKTSDALSCWVKMTAAVHPEISDLHVNISSTTDIKKCVCVSGFNQLGRLALGRGPTLELAFKEMCEQLKSAPNV